jgi:hypothetical protein
MEHWEWQEPELGEKAWEEVRFWAFWGIRGFWNSWTLDGFICIFQIQVETRISVNFQSEDFHVEIADLMDVGRPLPGPDGLWDQKAFKLFIFLHSLVRPDVSVLGPDCAHLSARGLSLLHAQLWNWLLQPRARSQPFGWHQPNDKEITFSNQISAPGPTAALPSTALPFPVDGTEPTGLSPASAVVDIRRRKWQSWS